MKKIIIFCIMSIGIIVMVYFNYTSYIEQHNKIKKDNIEFEKIYQKEIYGTELITIINKAINSNEKNDVELSQSKQYVENNINSIKIDIKMTDIDATYSMEIIYNGGIESFIDHYRDIKFKCTKLEYHKETKRIKYLYFEQISQ